MFRISTSLFKGVRRRNARIFGRKHAILHGSSVFMKTQEETLQRTKQMGLLHFPTESCPGRRKEDVAAAHLTSRDHYIGGWNRSHEEGSGAVLAHTRTSKGCLDCERSLLQQMSTPTDQQVCITEPVPRPAVPATTKERKTKHNGRLVKK